MSRSICGKVCSWTTPTDTKTPSSCADSRVETVFLASDERYMYLSSTTVREIASYGGDISRFVPAEILDDLMIKLNGRK